jgi:hypothetical protein
MMRRLLTVSVLAVAIAAALVVAPSQATKAEARVFDPPASAPMPWDPPPPSGWQDYGVSMISACTQQYGGPLIQAWPMSVSNAYSWRCYRVTSWVPYRLAYLGGVNVDQWCKRTYPGSFAVAEQSNWAYSWSCRRSVWA